MKYTLILIFIFASSLRLFGQQFHAVHIPKEIILNMRMDGFTSDWDWVKPRDYITTNLLNEHTKGYQVNEKNWGCKLIVGWSEVTNRIYVMAKVYDDIRHMNLITSQNAFWLNDDIEVVIYPKGTTSAKSLIRYHLLVPVKDKKDELTIDVGANWMKSYFNWGWRSLGNHKRPGYTIYEFSMPVWDSWVNTGASSSKLHILSVNEVLRLAFAFDDFDESRESTKQWDTSIGLLWYSNPNELSEFVLDPPVSNQVNWDNIIKTLKP